MMLETLLFLVRLDCFFGMPPILLDDVGWLCLSEDNDGNSLTIALVEMLMSVGMPKL